MVGKSADQSTDFSKAQHVSLCCLQDQVDLWDQMVGKSADQSTDFSNVQHVSHYAVFRTRLICGTRRLEINAAQSADFSEPQHTSCRTVFRIRLV